MNPRRLIIIIVIIMTTKIIFISISILTILHILIIISCVVRRPCCPMSLPKCCADPRDKHKLGELRTTRAVCRTQANWRPRPVVEGQSKRCRKHHGDTQICFMLGSCPGCPPPPMRTLHLMTPKCSTNEGLSFDHGHGSLHPLQVAYNGIQGPKDERKS